MKAITSVTSLLTIVFTFVPNDVRADWVEEEQLPVTLQKMARKGEIIDGIFKPSKNGFLGSGHFGITWRGQFLISSNDMEVAMKFTRIESFDTSETEYLTYSHLNAINNTGVLKYGIPTIYYYGTWNNYKLMAMTLLDSKYQQKIENGHITPFDLLIACREFVKVIKYVHSRGIIHNDCKITNIIIQNGHGFIYDFGISMNMNEFTRTDNIRFAKAEFKRFLYSLFPLVQPDWLGFGPGDEKRMRNDVGFVYDLAKDAKTNEGNAFNGLRRVFVELAKHASDKEPKSIRDSNGTPFYDQLYAVICEEMETNGSIKSIPDPFGTGQTGLGYQPNISNIDRNDGAGRLAR